MSNLETRLQTLRDLDNKMKDVENSLTDEEKHRIARLSVNLMLMAIYASRYSRVNLLWKTIRNLSPKTYRIFSLSMSNIGGVGSASNISSNRE